ncbi:MAG: hypothetical protein Q8O10_01220 [candidate division Zixibacteria bacterium]|nr:hypothetical protein [candidate division Zixibacteria bacterium]
MIIKKIEILVLLGCIALFLTVCQNPFSSGGNGGFKVITGTVQRGVEWECWVLISTSGKSYELYGERSSEIKKEGIKVKVMGKILTNTVSFCMQGTPLEVISYQKLD